jgi:hypothetical protein
MIKPSVAGAFPNRVLALAERTLLAGRVSPTARPLVAAERGRRREVVDRQREVSEQERE